MNNSPAKVYRNLNTIATGSLIKAGSGVLLGWRFFNTAGAVQFVKLYDKATAPVIGTDVPKMTFPVASGVQETLSVPGGIAFANGIGIGATKNIADTDVTAPTANSVIAQVFYL